VFIDAIVLLGQACVSPHKHLPLWSLRQSPSGNTLKGLRAPPLGKYSEGPWRPRRIAGTVLLSKVIGHLRSNVYATSMVTTPLALKCLCDTLDADVWEYLTTHMLYMFTYLSCAILAQGTHP